MSEDKPSVFSGPTVIERMDDGVQRLHFTLIKRWAASGVNAYKPLWLLLKKYLNLKMMSDFTYVYLLMIACKHEGLEGILGVFSSVEIANEKKKEAENSPDFDPAYETIFIERRVVDK